MPTAWLTVADSGLTTYFEYTLDESGGAATRALSQLSIFFVRRGWSPADSAQLGLRDDARWSGMFVGRRCESCEAIS